MYDVLQILARELAPVQQFLLSYWLVHEAILLSPNYSSLCKFPRSDTLDKRLCYRQFVAEYPFLSHCYICYQVNFQTNISCE
ncbi:hypothetical protein EUGRSUZ_J00088 [Eucalyptus grandis]|uniref:Uncharacterized protein n=2 Tax=Eucalyptus grandis TaxID=71139 RepID=A0ACC3J0N2_EUCGR|nr:hypothetical protein EUGRSUZ_J00088 [Eucalyptus grandis]